MQKILVIANDKALEEVNAVLTEGWRVTTILPNSSGAWLVVLSDIATWEDIVAKTTTS